jgi:hypothetical protein
MLDFACCVDLAAFSWTTVRRKLVLTSASSSRASRLTRKTDSERSHRSGVPCGNRRMLLHAGALRSEVMIAGQNRNALIELHVQHRSVAARRRQRAARYCYEA